jgi:nucleoside-diphosphate-sugar epimerase
MTGVALLAGGGRFVGRRLLSCLLACGYRVDVLNRGVTMPARDLPPGARHLAANRSDPVAVRGAIGGRSYDVAFDTSGYRPGEVRSVLGALDAGRYVYISTCMVYTALAPVAPEPGAAEAGPLGEDDDTVPPRDDEDGDLAAGYPGYKRGCELVLLAQDRVPAVVLRPCGIYGVGDHWYRHDYFFDRVVRGRPILVPDSHCARKVHLTSIDGLIEVCALAGRWPAPRHLVLNVADADVATCAELAALCAGVAGAAPDVRGYPAELATRLAPGAPPRAAFPFGPEPGFSLSCARAAATLGWPGASLAGRTAALFADFTSRREHGRTASPDFSLDDAILRELGVGPGAAGRWPAGRG